MVRSSVFESTDILAGRAPMTPTISESELLTVFSTEDVPVFIDGELHWSGDMTAEGLP